MSRKVWCSFISLALIAALVGFCLPVQVAEGKEAISEKPKDLNIAFVFVAIVEEPWNTAVLQSIERVKKEKPHGLNINWDISESIYPPDVERVMKEYAKTGKYGIIWAHSSSYTTVDPGLFKKFPDILWILSGSGHEHLGGNVYTIDQFPNEPAYLMGMIAGLMTKSNVIGAVAAYPYADVNVPVNGYIDGARAVNPDIKVKMTYIESWFDPPKAKEASLAQIAAGADFIYAERFGPFEACKEKGIYGFGHFVDQNSLTPEVVVSSAIALWDPSIKYLIDAWWNHVTKGVPYDAPLKDIIFGMADGGSALAPYHGLAEKIPADVKAKVEKAKSDIMAGKLTVPTRMEPVKSE